MLTRFRLTAVALGSLGLVAASAPTPAPAALTKEAASCQAALAKGLAGFKKAKIKAWQKCLSSILKGKACDTVKRDAAIAASISKATATLTGKCSDALLFDPPPNGLGFATNCQLESGTLEPYEQGCYNLPVTNGSQLASCLICWKEGEIYEFLKIVNPCLQGTVPNGSDLDCGTPPGACPAVDDKASLGCLAAISKGAAKWLLAKEKVLEKCLNAVASGKITGPCPDATAAAGLAKALAKLGPGITKKCTALPSWWDVCPEDSSAPCDQTIASVNDIVNCVANASEEIVDEMICWQYPDADTQGITCPAEAPGCCSPVRIVTTSSAGTLEVATIPAFPFPPNVITTVDTGAAGVDCKHSGTVPPGGFSVPPFCIPALGFTSDVIPLGCESGTADGQAMVWDGASTAPDPDVNTVGDTSDPDGASCGTLGIGCVTAPGGAGFDNKGNNNKTRGGAPHAGGSMHIQMDVPVDSITWVDADGDCPDLDGVYDPGTDTPVSDFVFILSPTTGSTSATFTDLNGDACAKAGAGPVSKSGVGIAPAGPCCTVGQTVQTAATNTVFSGGAPLYDLAFKSITPSTVSACTSPASDTCTLTTDPCLD
ncbi:MAG TPA: hypothetical protein VKA21_10305 [Candidatus Binatia bacterium]|nr:hypothetical protein [Candidatus Binatia bacterium]